MTDTAIANAARAVVHRVDARDRLIAELNAVNLPPNQQQALAIVRRRIHDMGPRFHSEVHAALRAIEAVAVYGVERVPAVVLDSSRVVYGVTDVAQAIEVVRRGGGQPIRQRFVPGAAEGRSGPTHAPARRRAP